MHSWDVFSDVEEEAAENKLRIARDILAQYSELYKIKEIEILDYVETRKCFQKELVKLKKGQAELNLGRRKLKKNTSP